MKIRRRKKIAVTMTAWIFGVILILSVIIATEGYLQFTSVLEKQYYDSAYNVLQTVITNLNPEKFEDYLKTGEADEEYEQIEKMLDNLVVANNCNFIYVAKVSNDYTTLEYIYDSPNPKLGFDRYSIGYKEIDLDPNQIEDNKYVVETGSRAKKNIYSYSESGPHTTTAQGVKNKEGEVIAIACVEKPMLVIDDARSRYVRNVAYTSLAMAILVIVCSIYLFNRVVVNPVLEINNEAERFAAGGKEPATELKAMQNSFEIGSLAYSLQKMEMDIANYIEDITKITAERERIGVELDLAEKIQRNYMPCIFPPFPERNEFELYATMNPAKEVGGDFYDFFLIDEDHLGMVIADVSGKGIGAALFMMISKTLMNIQTKLIKSPAEVLRQVNDILCENNAVEMFVTVWLGILDIKTGVLITANAGHEYPAIRRANGDFELFKDKHGLVLAAMPGIRFKQCEIQLKEGDTLYVYTDGVTEATNAEQELYGTDRMLQALDQYKEQSMEELLKGVKKEIDGFVKEAPQFDDITMLGLRYYGEKESF